MPTLDALRHKFKPDTDEAWLVAELVRTKGNTQAFFAQLAAEMTRPHFGDIARGYFRPLLVRAQEAGLWDPNQESS